MDITPQQATDFAHATIPAIGRLGVRVVRLGPGEVELVVPIEGNGNHFGTMYAGALFSLVEMPGGFIPLSVLGPQFTPIVTRVDIRFLAAARSDVHLTARIEPEQLRQLADEATREGKAEFTLDLTGQDDDGRTVVECTAYYQLRPSR
jgi:acyl-coenzyme A thioesterase PaaI-like protein